MVQPQPAQVTLGSPRPGFAMLSGRSGELPVHAAGVPRSPPRSPGPRGRAVQSPPRIANGSLQAGKRPAGDGLGFVIQARAQSLNEASARLAAVTAAVAANAAHAAVHGGSQGKVNVAASETSEKGMQVLHAKVSAAVAAPPEKERAAQLAAERGLGSQATYAQAAASPKSRPGQPRSSPQEPSRGDGLAEPMLGTGAAVDGFRARLVPVVLFVLGILCVEAGFELAASEQEAAEKLAAATGGRMGTVPDFRWQLVPVLAACLLGLAGRCLCRSTWLCSRKT